MMTQTFEPIRPLRAPDNGAAYADKIILSSDYRVDYGRPEWPSRSYTLILNGTAPTIWD